MTYIKVRQLAWMAMILIVAVLGHTSSALGQPALQGLRQQGIQALRRADYPAMLEAYAALTAAPDSTIDDALWQARAFQLAGQWPQACAAYHRAMDKISHELANPPPPAAAQLQPGRGPVPAKYLREQWADVVLLVGRMELTELKSPTTAVKTLSQGLQFAPEAGLPLDELATLAVAEKPKKSKPDWDLIRRSIDLITPLETQRYLAMAYEQLGQNEAAFDTWTRVRLCSLAYDVSQADTDPEHLQALFSQLSPEQKKPSHEAALKHPDREVKKKRDVEAYLAKLRKPPRVINPLFEKLPLPKFDFTELGPNHASLARLSDGRRLIAYTTGYSHQTRIMLSISSDLSDWEDPWEFEHNSVFHTRNPCLLADDQGSIWMLFFSQRLNEQVHSSGGYDLWLTHSRDGRHWAPLRCLSPETRIARAQYTDTAQLTRSPDGRCWIFWNHLYGVAQTPGDIAELKELELPLDKNSLYPSDVSATFDQNGACHLVFSGGIEGIYYTRSPDMQTWLPLVQMAKREEGSSTEFPQLFLDGDRAALIHETTHGTWWQRGSMQADGLALGKPEQIIDSLMPFNGSRLFRDGETWIVPVGENYRPGLVKVPYEKLFSAAADPAN